jgi:hypothetical protein
VAEQKGTTSGPSENQAIRVLGPAGAEPGEAGGRAFRAKRKPAPKRGRHAAHPPSYFVLSAARFCLLVFNR